MQVQEQAAVFRDEVSLDRPLLRGWFHVWAAVAALAGTALLLLLADSPSAYVGGAVFAGSLVLLYGTSATYHRITWGPSARRIVKRLDHSMIFVLIAGTYTPITLYIGGPWGFSMLSVVWGIAGGGMLMKVIWPDAPRWLGVAMYLALGWMALIAAAELFQTFSLGPIVMLALGGVFYTAGGIIYAVRRPNPWPRVFGYHEVFHALVVAGSATHYALVAAFVLPN